MPLYGYPGPTTTKKGWWIDLSGLRPYIASGVQEITEPKESRKAEQMMGAIAAIARLGGFPALSRLPQEWQKSIWESMFTYQPSFLRKTLKKEKPELLMEAPKTRVEMPEEEAKMIAPISEAAYTPAPSQLAYKTQYFPKGTQAPLIDPEYLEQLNKYAGERFTDPEERQAFVNNTVESWVSGFKPTAEEIRFRNIAQAQKYVDSYKAANPGASDEEAINSIPARLRTQYADHMATVEAMNAYKRQQTEALKTGEDIKKRDMLLKENRESRLSKHQDWYEKYMENKLAQQKEIAGLSRQGKSYDEVMRNAHMAYSRRLQAWERDRADWERMEINLAREAVRAGGEYTPTRFSEPRPTWEEWLQGEGFDFAVRLSELSKAEGKGLPPKQKLPSAFPQPRGRTGTPEDREDKMTKFLFGGGVGELPPPTTD